MGDASSVIVGIKGAISLLSISRSYGRKILKTGCRRDGMVLVASNHPAIVPRINSLA